MSGPLLGRLAVVLALVLCLGAVALVQAAPASARDGGDRVEVSEQGVCGRASSVRLRLRAEDGRIRVDTEVRTSRTGVWRVTVLHERRIVVRRVRVRATRAERGFEHRVVVPDYVGADAVSVRAVAPGGETCTATATVAGS